jgi:predicted transcriptional regulator
MGQTILHARPDDPMSRAAELIAQHESDVLVFDHGKPVGVIRGIDVVKAIAEGRSLETKVGEMMLRPPPLVQAGASAKEVADVARRLAVRTVFVSNGDEVTGRVELDEMVGLMASSWDKVDVHKALATHARVRIAELLSTKPMSVDEIARATGMKPITVRHHLEILRIGGIVNTEEKHGKVGRPLTLFSSAGFLPESV